MRISNQLSLNPRGPKKKKKKKKDETPKIRIRAVTNDDDVDDF